MIVFHDVEQNTEEWFQLRSGRITGSIIGKIMANFGKAFGDPAKRLAYDIAAQRVKGEPSVSNGFSNFHMERGHEQEPIARALYEDEFFVEVQNGGYFDSDPLGCSPDGRVGDDGLIEIKSVVAATHYETVKRDDIDPAYKWQVPFNMMVADREWIDFVSFCADWPEGKQLYIKRLYKDQCGPVFADMRSRIAEFMVLVKEVEAFINKYGR